jgi:hypothetical protein
MASAMQNKSDPSAADGESAATQQRSPPRKILGIKPFKLIQILSEAVYEIVDG